MMMMITDDEGDFDGGGDWGCRVEEMGERGGGGGGGDVVVGMWGWRFGRRGKGQCQEDLGQCLCQVEVSQTFLNERSARKQTSCRHETSAHVCTTQT
ncbi:hypothetical protein HanXRQr2_Chr09g0363381 [Helianthus annuus]|uniref:Uncharacterized protein n=1 Tax=Helianthus annuus TaxID=4232 RepID=A0A9K3N6L4_HELAN|nr:hypothetical protein HanXRQr2_Chr09g0363381 [Helianthus annuus]